MNLLFVSFSIGCLGALLSLVISDRYRITVASLSIIAESTLSAFASLNVIVDEKRYSYTATQVLPLFGIKLTFNSVNALFVFITSFLAIAIGIYQMGYGKHAVRAKISVFTFPIFITSMLLIPLAASVVTFMAVWELMAITSILLVLTDHKVNNKVGKATQWYSIMTHLGAALIFLGLVILVTATGHQQFSLIFANIGRVGTPEKCIAFFLIFLGFGSKAGIVPLHIWLPYAHPQAPSPMSAMMSGAMVNLGIYGIIRFDMMLLGRGANWWWIIVVAVGSITAIYGSLQCVLNSDLKQLLAYSTVDNVGLMVIGVGVSGLLISTGQLKFASLVMMGVFFQLLAHSIFKGLLFLTAGAIQYSRNTLSIDMLGGLLKTLPTISICMLIGVGSISAIPPFSGFSSEFVLFEGLFQAVVHLSGIDAVAILMGVTGFALAGGLTATAFIKTAGIALLGISRSPKNPEKTKIPFTMIGGTLMLAISCVFMGMVPNLILDILEKSTRTVFSKNLLNISGSFGSISIKGMTSDIQVLILFCSSIIFILGIYGVSKLFSLRKLRTVDSWGCGSNYSSLRTQYTATSFAGPLQKIFEDIVKPAHDIKSSHAEESKFYIKSVKYTYNFHDRIETAIYDPIKRLILIWGKVTSKIQNGSVHRYIAFGFIGLLAVMVFLT